MIGRIIRNTLALVLVFAILSGVVLAARVIKYNFEIRHIEKQYGVLQDGERPPSFVAFTADGTRLLPARREKGLAVWYGSRGCPYCKSDQQWTGLGEFLQENGVGVVVLAPSLKDLFQPPELRPRTAAQAAFVGSEWLRHYPLSITPTLLIFDRDEKLVWHKVGVLSAQDSASVRQLVGAGLR